MALARGDVVWVTLPAPAGAPGREQFGTRPAIVVQPATGYGALPTVLVVPVTSNRGTLRFPGTMPVAKSPANGLTADSVALVFQVRAIDRARIGDRLGRLSGADARQLDEKLAAVLGLRGR